MSSECQYIYGIIRESEAGSFTVSGVADARVYTVKHQGVAAVVSDIGLKEIDPTRKNVLAHTLVQEALLKNYTLLPMGFGVIADSRDDVSKLLERNYQGLLDELKRLEGKVEVELKIFWNQEAVIKELQSGGEELIRLMAKVHSAPSALEARQLLVEAGKSVENIILDWKAKYADRVYSTLKGLSLDARLNNPVGIKNILNASFLIEKTGESYFLKEVYKLNSQYQGKFDFKYVAPLAPYNFVNMKLEPVS